MKKKSIRLILGTLFLSGATTVQAQINAADSVMNHVQGNKLSVGGYGEAAFSRMFYSDNIYRYSEPGKYKNDPSHGRFDIPHAVIYLGYDFGEGWSMGSEIEFEHTGTGSAYEKDYEEGGEWESETEKGGEVEVEQFWLQKSLFDGKLNIRAGHIVVPVGLNNSHHEPLNFFTVYRPEGENTILPSTWHETGLSIWGKIPHWRYEVQFLPGLDAMNFNRTGWIANGANSSFEFKAANKYAAAMRIDNTSIKGLRIGFSGYIGNSIDNTYTRNSNGTASHLNGTVSIGSIDFSFNRYNWIVRGQATYGHLSDAYNIYYLDGRQSKTSPYSSDLVGKNAIATGIETGYNIFSQIEKLRTDNQKFYIFGRYEYYNSYIREKRQAPYDYTAKNIVDCGFNWYPIQQIVIKCDYQKRFLKKQYNDEPSLNIGIAYEGFFL
jgi:hypothetical protein